MGKKGKKEKAFVNADDYDIDDNNVDAIDAADVGLKETGLDFAS